MSDEYTERNNSAASSSFIRDRSPATVDFDNMIRRKLRVSDPRNQEEIAEALGKLYVVKKREIDAEASGMPFMTVLPPFERIEDERSSSVELDQATSDVDRDLNSLTSNSLLKDIQPELNGWAAAIRSAISDGVNAARFSLDPRQRDKTFAVRRLLGDYARIARYVGAMTPTLSLPYRRLSQSLDEVSGVLLVLMGEALANIGFSGGNFILQVPLSELQERRDAVIYALRNLIGTTQHSGGNDEWPRGLVAYRQFLDKLSQNAQHDIRALFQENELARTMDDLIDRAAGTTSEGLRALGATAQPTLERFRRLIRLGLGEEVDPPSPPFTAFLEALGLFLVAFENSNSGYRLLAISRPSLVYYGLYGIGSPDNATQRLEQLVIQRGRLAEALDCYLGCKCDCDKVRCQIILDKILYDVDRAIDLYALGTEDAGEPEKRAAAYGYIIKQVLPPDGSESDCLILPSNTTTEEILVNIHDQLLGPISNNGDEVMRDELCMQYDAELHWYSLLKTMAPSCIKFEPSEDLCKESTEALPTCDIINQAMENLSGNIDDCKVKPFIPRHLEDSHEEVSDSLAVSGKYAITINPDEQEFNVVIDSVSFTISNIGTQALGPILLCIVEDENAPVFNIITPLGQLEEIENFTNGLRSRPSLSRPPGLVSGPRRPPYVMPIGTKPAQGKAGYIEILESNNFRIVDIQFVPPPEGSFEAEFWAIAFPYTPSDSENYPHSRFCYAVSVLKGQSGDQQQQVGSRKSSIAKGSSKKIKATGAKKKQNEKTPAKPKGLGISKDGN